jgi:hypothetical protein
MSCQLNHLLIILDHYQQFSRGSKAWLTIHQVFEYALHIVNHIHIQLMATMVCGQKYIAFSLHTIWTHQSFGKWVLHLGHDKSVNSVSTSPLNEQSFSLAVKSYCLCMDTKGNQQAKP